tara:strand:+ start:8252 stop:8506 length:255 start_codon:yes stop_codon:yes gene_type:complete
MTVRELLQRIDSTELAEWIAYYGIEPFGQEREALHSGIIAATIANAHSSSKCKTYQPADFMPDFEAKEQSIDDMKAILNQMAGG